MKSKSSISLVKYLVETENMLLDICDKYDISNEDKVRLALKFKGLALMVNESEDEWV